MAKINCPKCKNPVEPSAKECPKCGVIFKKFQENILRAEQAKKEKEQKIRQQRLKNIKPCDACGNAISKSATICPRCGHPQIESTSSLKSDKSVSGLLDFEFKNFITPSLVKIIYGLNVVFVIILLLLMIVSNFTSFKVSFGYIVGSIFGMVVYLLATRIGCEAVLLLFKIEENTRR